MGYQASPADGDHALHAHAIHVGRFSLDPLLRLIDAATASLQRLRHRLEAPADDQESAGRGKAVAHVAHADDMKADAAPKARRLRRFAAVAFALSCAAAAGMAVSYKLLSQSVRTNEVVAEALRDEIAELEKDGARLLGEKSKHQKQVYEHEKEIRVLQQEVEDARAEAEELRHQVDALKGVRNGPLAQAAAAAPGRRTAPEKTGTCTMGGANAAASLARCVDEFNRK